MNFSQFEFIAIAIAAIIVGYAIYKILNSPILKNKLATNARQINTTNSLKNISSQWQKLIFSPEISN